MYSVVAHYKEGNQVVAKKVIATFKSLALAQTKLNQLQAKYKGIQFFICF